MKLFTGGLMLESNTFSPIPTGLESFQATCLKRGTASIDRDVELLSEPLRVWRSLIEARGGSNVEGLFAVAEPGGPVTTPVYEALRDELLANIRAALPLDCVLLFLHGSMASVDCDDCEGDILERVRAVVGPNVVVGVELDLHASLSQKMVDAADMVVTCKEYPHTDFGTTAERLLDLCCRKADGSIHPTSAIIDCRMVGLWRTTEGNVRAFVDQMRRYEEEPGILSVSFAHGFPWADVPDSGARILVTTDGDPALAARTAEELRQQLWTIRDDARTHYYTIDEALDLAELPSPGPTVVADVSDNTGGGAAGDSTFILQALLERGTGSAAVCSLWDPMAVRLCCAAGEGARIDLRLGGKTGPASGWPLDVTVDVRKIILGAGQIFQDAWVGIGDAVWLKIADVDVIVCSLRVQTFDPTILTQFGIDPSALRVIVVKSTQHFHRGFSPLAAQILYVAAPGANYPDFKKIAYRRKRGPYWPAVSDPFDPQLSEEAPTGR